ncbi:glycosyltransferase family 4 protein [Aeromonas caviae]|uniref:glycosyltransferase family 4 protein n=1 Tax=Aeromonas caviae TaxID=648 RepID=UPI002280EC6A|nr:glycosyltransferase family 4 protein [Aeromonas caviae]MCY9811135.1 glycosyltransferase family 4 protein [Aeromonas caviae]
MKLALIIDDYLPNSTRVGSKMFHELAVYLTQQGHQVTVITPETRQTSTLVCDELDGVTIWHFKSGEIKDVSKIKRAINESMLSLRAWLAVRTKIEKDSFDGVIYYSPSIFWGGVVRWLCRRCHCSAYLVLRDLFPRWAIDAGMIGERSLITRYFRFFERLSYRQAKMIGLMSDNNINVFKKEEGNHYPTEVLRNWAALTPISQLPDDYLPLRQRLKLQDKVIFFYGGNIGHAQDMANLMRLTKAMSRHPQAHFLYVGQGDEVELINKLAREWNLSNFTYLSSVNQNEFKLILTEIDVGLFSLSADHTSHNFPGKLLGYMVQNIPILGSVNQGNDLMELINTNRAGIIRVNGDDVGLYEAAESLLKDDSFRQRLGRQANELLHREFSVSTAAEVILKEFKKDNF